MGKEYERIRAKVAQDYKDTIRDLRQQLALEREVRVRLENRNAELEDENYRLRKIVQDTENALPESIRQLKKMTDIFGAFHV